MKKKCHNIPILSHAVEGHNTLLFMQIKCDIKTVHEHKAVTETEIYTIYVYFHLYNNK